MFSHVQIKQQTNQNEINEPQCKFCFQSQKQSKQQLISPCGCNGTMKYVHKDCLQKWINTQIDKKDGPLPQKSKLNGFNYQCKLCEKDIILSEQLCHLRQILIIIQWIYIIYYIKKIKYYFCISVIGSLAINYYFGKFFLGKIVGFITKIKQYSIISFMVFSFFMIFYDLTFIQLKWNSSSLSISIPFLMNK